MIRCIVVLNIMWISFLAHKLKSIKGDPRKYNTIPNYKAYRDSKWYWPENKEHHKGDPPDLATVYFTPFFIGVALYYFASSEFIYYSSMPRLENTVRFFPEGVWSSITFFMYALYSLLVSFYFPLLLKSPQANCFSTFHIFPKRSRADKCLIMTRFVLIVTVLLFPFRVLALSNKGYANSEEIVYHPFWSCSDQHYVYNEIVDIQFVVKEDRVIHCYLVNDKGKKFDLLENYTNIDNSEETTKNAVVNLMPEHLRERITLGTIDALSSRS